MIMGRENEKFTFLLRIVSDVMGSNNNTAGECGKMTGHKTVVQVMVVMKCHYKSQERKRITFMCAQ